MRDASYVLYCTVHKKHGTPVRSTLSTGPASQSFRNGARGDAVARPPCAPMTRSIRKYCVDTQWIVGQEEEKSGACRNLIAHGPDMLVFLRGVDDAQQV